MNRLVIFTIAMLLVLGCGGPKKEVSEKQMHQDLQNDNNDYFAEGLKFVEKSAVPEAVQSLQKAIRKNPQDTRPYLVLAEIYMRLQNYQSASDALQAVLNIDPGNGGAAYLLAVSTGLKGERAQAVEIAKKAAEIFKLKKDEVNLKKSLALIQGLTNVGQPSTQ